MFLPADNRKVSKAKTTTIHHGEGAHRLDSSINLRYKLGCIQFSLFPRIVCCPPLKVTGYLWMIRRHQQQCLMRIRIIIIVVVDVNGSWGTTVVVIPARFHLKRERTTTTTTPRTAGKQQQEKATHKASLEEPEIYVAPVVDNDSPEAQEEPEIVVLPPFSILPPSVPEEDKESESDPQEEDDENDHSTITSTESTLETTMTTTTTTTSSPSPTVPHQVSSFPPAKQQQHPGRRRMGRCHGSPRQCPGGPPSSFSSPSQGSSRRRNRTVAGHSCASRPNAGSSHWCRTWVTSKATSVADATAAASTTTKNPSPSRMGGPWVRPHGSSPSSCQSSHGQPNVLTVHHHQHQQQPQQEQDNRVIPRSRTRPSAVGTTSSSGNGSVATVTTTATASTSSSWNSFGGPSSSSSSSRPFLVWQRRRGYGSTIHSQNHTTNNSTATSPRSSPPSQGSGQRRQRSSRRAKGHHTYVYC